MNQVEFLLRLSENARDEGDVLARRHISERDAHVKELEELYNMIEAARQNVWSELSRWGALNKQPEKIVQAPQQGKLPRATQANSGTTMNTVERTTP